MTTNTQELTSAADAGDQALLLSVVAAVQAAGSRLKSRFSFDARPGNWDQIRTAIHANDEASLSLLRDALRKARPEAIWMEDEDGSGALPSGECWVTDPAEGNINHIHGIADWGVTAALVRDNLAALSVVYLPLTGETYTAIRGGGAFLNGIRLRVSAKTDLSAALVGTGQATPGESTEICRQIGRSVVAMLESALLVRVSVPAALQLIHVAAGRMDVFWQYSQSRAGLLPGALLVEEAGGTLTDTQGQPWSLSSADFLAAAPGLRDAAVSVLSHTKNQHSLTGA